MAKTTTNTHKRLLLVLMISLLGLFAFSNLPKDLAKKLEIAHAQLNEIDSLIHSSHYCDDNTCIFRNVCSDGFKISYYSNDANVSFPKLILAANYHWALQNLRTHIPVKMLNLEHSKMIKSDKIFVPDPVILMKMHAVGNLGHTLLQNILPYLQLSLERQKELKSLNETRLIALNNCDACGEPTETCNGEGSFGYKNCDEMKDQLFPLILNKPLILFEDLLKVQGDDKQVCFKTVAVGINTHLDLLNVRYDADYAKKVAKKRLYENVGLQLDYPAPKTPVINILVYCKVGGRHGGAIANCEMVNTLIKSKFSGSFKGIPIKVSKINFDKAPVIADQMKVISEAHIYIANGGAASFYGLFLRDGAVSLIMPQCHNCICNDAFPVSRLAPGITYLPISSKSVDCPTTGCQGNCKAQNIPLLPDFEDDLADALQVAYKSISDGEE